MKGMKGMFTKARGCLAAAATAAMTLTLAPGTAFADNASQPIQQEDSGLCLDTLQSGTAQVSNGDAVYLNSCDHSANQEWIAIDTRLVGYQQPVVTGLQAADQATAKCLDLTNGSTTPGQYVQFWDCNSQNPNQQWARQLDGTIMNPTTGLCLDSAPNASGQQLVTATCDGNSGTQKFRFLDRGTDGDPVNLDEPWGPIHGEGGACMDAWGGYPDGFTATNGQQVALNTTCNGLANQEWQITPDNTIHSGGKCLDIPGGTGFFGSTTGNPVQLYDCNGTDAQTWLLGQDGTIYNPGGYCLSFATTAGVQGGTLLGIQPCWVSSSQQFDLPAHAYTR
jgi:hypothetical protein